MTASVRGRAPPYGPGAGRAGLAAATAATAAAALLAWGVVAGCAPVLAARTGVEPASDARSHVVIISIDGLRPEAIDRFRMRTLQRLIAEGAYTATASTVLPSHTLPSHTSMLTGVSPAVHRIDWNTLDRSRGVVGVPTVFELSRAHGHETASFYAKAKFRHLDRPDSYDYREGPAHNPDLWMATDVVPAVVRYLRHRRPNLLFVHVAEPDYAGHAMGWMGRLYGLAARRADAAVARVLEAAARAFGEDGFTVIVTSDHGGIGRGHGGAHVHETTIPWIVRGPHVVPGAKPGDVRTMDTAATALWLLGVPLPPALEGRPVVEAFSAAAPAP